MKDVLKRKKVIKALENVLDFDGMSQEVADPIIDAIALLKRDKLEIKELKNDLDTVAFIFDMMEVHYE